MSGAERPVVLLSGLLFVMAFAVPDAQAWYHKGSWGDPDQPPAAAPAGPDWKRLTDLPPGQNVPLSTGDEIWLGMENGFQANKFKIAAVSIQGTNLGNLRGGIDKPSPNKHNATDDWGGLDAQAVPPTVQKPKKAYPLPVTSAQTTKKNYGAQFDWQPDAEWLKLTAAGDLTITQVNWDTWCIDNDARNKERACVAKHIKATSNLDPPHRDMFWFFPDEVAVDTSVVPTFTAAPETGNWTYQFVTVDPYGQARPLGGVKWVTDGPGIADGDEFSFSFSMMDSTNSNYIAFENMPGIDVIPLRFDCPEPGSGLILLLGVGSLVRRRLR